MDEEWSAHIDPTVLDALPESEINRQTIIHKLISNEVQYLKDLDVIDSVRISCAETRGRDIATYRLPRK